MVRIDDIKSLEKYSCVGGPFGSSLSRKHYVDSGVPVIRGVNLSGDSFSESDFVFVSKDKALELQRNMAFRGDLVFTQRGTLGQVALIPEDSKYDRYVVSQSQMKLTVNSEIADPYFVYSYFRTTEAKTLIERSAIVGGVPHINLGILKEFKLKLPPLCVQKRVANISRILDNKITLNRQINQTLEQMAQTLFKSWFVDFDPVMDNALDAGNPIPDELQHRAEARKAVRESEGFKPLPDDVRQLFPDAFEESELGWVPKGWVTKQLRDLTVTTKGKSYKSSELAESKTALVTLKSFQRGGGYRLDGLKPYTGKFKPEQEVKAGDLVIAYTDVTQAADIIGKPAIVISDPEFDTLVVSLDVAVVRPNDSVLKYYLYALAKTPRFQSHTYAHSTGTTVLHLSKDAVPDYQMPLPDMSIIAHYDRTIAPLFESIEKNICSSRTLTKLRDTLLPKLISGELRLDDIELAVEQEAVSAEQQNER
ncbi:restriction endonuclease subunit S [Vibrio cholerae]|uniref:restriction endonuclease subunit S n=1 Tax=Vibrio cholerae TaxID=666 RepID=UPI00196629E9|nr:restriction endonuclease subunit S [Vibrio cholerae]